MKNDIFGYRRKTNKAVQARWLKWMTNHVSGLTPPPYARHGDWRSRKNQKKMLWRIRQAYAQDKRPNVKWLTRRSLGKLIPKLDVLAPIPLRGHRADGIVFDDLSAMPAGLAEAVHARLLSMPMAQSDITGLRLIMDKHRPGEGQLQVMMDKPLETIKFEVDLKDIETKIVEQMRRLPSVSMSLTEMESKFNEMKKDFYSKPLGQSSQEKTP